MQRQIKEVGRARRSTPPRLCVNHSKTKEKGNYVFCKDKPWLRHCERREAGRSNPERWWIASSASPPRNDEMMLAKGIIAKEKPDPDQVRGDDEWDVGF
ncbi:hypothetical protein [Novosphingobium sp. CECT 9465]|uniref:hypothetical protein n=1 Tax=Novosphingobium sp. CECT 9465 TaxID=2829794 RepID=UPI001E51927E|nr:hypothetical protein [Novosphingobium sp. CECT 9465]